MPDLAAIDREIQAMRAIIDVLAPFDRTAQVRTLQYLLGRYQAQQATEETTTKSNEG